MSLGLRIVATGGMYSVNSTPKEGYTEGMIDTTPIGNAYTFSGAAFG